MDRRTVRLAIHMTHDKKRTILVEADAQCQSLSEFVRQSALYQATDALLERQAFLSLTADGWEAFTAALGAPRHDLPQLRALLNS